MSRAWRAVRSLPRPAPHPSQPSLPTPRSRDCLNDAVLRRGVQAILYSRSTCRAGSALRSSPSPTLPPTSLLLTSPKVTYAPKTRLLFLVDAVAGARGVSLNEHEVRRSDGQPITELQLYPPPPPHPSPHHFCRQLPVESLALSDAAVRLIPRATPPTPSSLPCSCCSLLFPPPRLVWQTGPVRLCAACFLEVQERRHERIREGLGLNPVNELEDPLLPQSLMRKEKVKVREKEDERGSEPQGKGNERDPDTDSELKGKKGEKEIDLNGKEDGMEDGKEDPKTSHSRPKHGMGGKDSSRRDSARKELDRKRASDIPSALLERVQAVHHLERNECLEHSHALYYVLKTCYPAKFPGRKRGERKEKMEEKKEQEGKEEEKEEGKEGKEDREEGEADGEELMEEDEEEEDAQKPKRGKKEPPPSVRYVPPEVAEEGRRWLAQHGEEAKLKRQYKMEHEAGQGGFGSVFLAKDTVRRRQVAVKRVKHTTSKEVAVNEGEVGFLALSQHPNIVTFLDAHVRLGKKGSPSEAWYPPFTPPPLPHPLRIVLEFLHGGTLKRAASSHRFSDSHVAFLAQEVLAGLAYLHDRGWVHRDIKSANVMLDARGLVKLIDFGL